MVPVRGPVAKMSLFAGESGSTLGSISSERYFVPRPRDPRNVFAHSMLSGSGVQRRLLRSTRRTRRCQDMTISSSIGGAGGGLAVEAPRPLAHALEPGPVRVDEGDGARGARLGAGR